VELGIWLGLELPLGVLDPDGVGMLGGMLEGWLGGLDWLVLEHPHTAVSSAARQVPKMPARTASRHPREVRVL
jgi:hypothetical protein